jgi:integrase
MLKVVKKNGKLWVTGRLLGQQVRRTTGLPVGHEREAEQLRLKWEKEIVDGTFKNKTRKHTFTEAVDKYGQWKEMNGGWSDHTMRLCQRFEKIFAGVMVEDMTTEMIHDKVVKEFVGLEPGTVRRYLNILSAVLRHSGDLWGVPVAKVKRPRVDDERDVHFDEDEVNQFLTWVRDSRPWYYPHFLVLTDCGVRLNELLRLTKRDFAGDVLKVRRRVKGNGKTEGRTIPLTDDVKAMVSKMVDTGPVFGKKCGSEFPDSNTASAYLGKVLREGCAELGLPALRVHDLRHTFAYLVAQGGADLGDLQTLLGHEDISQTMRYRGFVLSRARQAVTAARTPLGMGQDVRADVA